MARLTELLQPDETVLLREGRSVWAILAWLVAPVAFVALLLWLLSFGNLGNELFGLLALVFGIVIALFLFLGGFQFLFDLALIGLHFDHWRIAVTDQRVLVRRGALGLRHDEIARTEIETHAHDRAGGRLTLTGAGRQLVIACSRAQARRILKALGRI